MVNVLITGSNSYIGINIENWLNNYSDTYKIDTIDMKNQNWKSISFSGYDSIIHVAGIAHITNNKKVQHLYEEVNTVLAAETAKKAKEDGVRQFIFMSSIKVYSESDIKDGMIFKETIPNSKCPYGNSKLQAEKYIENYSSDNFKTAIIRSPMVYGRNSKGNYKKLLKFSKITPVFPLYVNQRSMIYIDNLCEFIRLLIDNFESGTFFPQNKEYVCTYEMIKELAYINNRKLLFTRIFNPVLKKLTLKDNMFSKMFGNLTYDYSLSEYKDNYQIRDFKESLLLSEGVNE